MKHIALVYVIAAVFAAPLWAVENPNVRSPVGSPTAVPSTQRSGLIPSRPHDIGRDPVVSGQVGGLAHFRGPVPYGSPHLHDAAVSSPLDNFLRRAHDPIAADRAPGQYRPYFDPRRVAATTVRVDGAELFSPLIPEHGMADPYIPPMLAQTVDTPYRTRPLSLSAIELDRVLQRQMQLHDDPEQRLRPEGIEDPTDVQDRIDSVFFRDYLLTEEIEPQPDEPAEIPPLEPVEPPTDEDEPDVLIPEEFFDEDDPYDAEAFERQLRQEQAERIDEMVRRQLEDDPDQQRPADPRRPAADPLDPQARRGRDVLDRLDDSALSEEARSEARALLSRYGSYEQLAAARVNRYLSAGEGFLNEGKFYKAADSFELAIAWAPNDARPFAGRAFALFAAGEYMSSAFNLRQAIRLNEKVASEPVDLARLIDDRDVFENRLIEMRTWQQRSGSGDLAFLMAFVLHHDGKPDRAAQAIQTAAEQLPDDRAVQILRDVIVPD